jgi:type I restriction enzyme M protein
MLDNGTKKRIDSARDILVGKVPDPKSQVEQITIAMIYKFMDDMDNQTEELGGKATFFAGKFKQYAWSRLLDSKLGGHERLILYAEGIEKMNINENIPQLFRDIFKGAFLPYRDPETLNLFLKEINGFAYDHSERLGDAFEYLLSVLSSQGDAGQFRTPRHIIDFIVEIVNPAKEDTVLDPACGTAGFLIASYKHILCQNTKNRPGDLLATDDKGRLMTNFCGYDISPDMVRLSLVNMYLHSFANPSIYEYDTLTSEDRWDERYDVILTNPPFMSPKGGIRPHSRFTIKAKRSEVLFVDYIAEHLNVHGRAGVIVPEGIIFQSQNAYKNLRKMLVDENYLYAVISLPAGIFNPYAGVKTSILLMDKTLAKKAGEILFVKVSDDGFDLGAQRMLIDKNDLPQALKIVKAWKEAIAKGKNFGLDETDKAIAHIVSKEKIAESGDYNLSGDKYKEVISYANVKWPMVELGEVLEKVKYPQKIKKADFLPAGKYPIIDQSEQYIAGYWNDEDCLYAVERPVVIFGDHTRIFKYIDFDFVLGADGVKILSPHDNLDPKFLYFLLQNIEIMNLGYSRHYKELVCKSIPIPPMEVQEKIVAELDGYQKITNGAKQVVENYKPTIKIDPDWPLVEFSNVCTLEYGASLPKKKRKQGPFPVVGSNGITGWHDSYLIKGPVIIVGRKGSAGEVVWIDENCFPIDTTYYIAVKDKTSTHFKFLYYILKQMRLSLLKGGGAVPGLNRNDVYQTKQIPLPPLKTQQKIVAEIESERELVEANKKLIEIFEKKIKDKIGEVWGE